MSVYGYACFGVEIREAIGGIKSVGGIEDLTGADFVLEVHRMIDDHGFTPDWALDPNNEGSLLPQFEIIEHSDDLDEIVLAILGQELSVICPWLNDLQTVVQGEHQLIHVATGDISCDTMILVGFGKYAFPAEFRKSELPAAFLERADWHSWTQYG